MAIVRLVNFLLVLLVASVSGTRPRRKLSGDGRVRVCVCVCECVPQWARIAASRHTNILAAIRLAATMKGVCANERMKLL